MLTNKDKTVISTIIGPLLALRDADDYLCDSGLDLVKPLATCSCGCVECQVCDLEIWAARDRGELVIELDRCSDPHIATSQK